MSDAPWSKADAEKWAEQWCDKPRCAQMNRNDKEWHRNKSSFLAGLAKAAEMLEASPTVYRNGTYETVLWDPERADGDTHQAKLVNIKPIEKGKSDE